MNYKISFIIVFGMVINALSAVIQIDPSNTIAYASNVGYGYDITARDDLLIASTQIAGSGGISVVSHEWNSGTGTYDTNEQTIVAKQTNQGHSMSYNSGTLVMGGSDGYFSIYTYVNNAWVLDWEQNFNTRCPTETSPISGWLTSPALRSCQTTVVSPDGSRVLVAEDNQWSRIYTVASNGGASELNVLGSAQHITQYKYAGSTFCGIDSEYLIVGSQSGGGLAAHLAVIKRTGTTWAWDHDIIIPESVNSVDDNPLAGFSVHCDVLTKTTIVIGTPRDEDPVTNNVYVGLVNVAKLSGGIWSIYGSSLRDGVSGSAYGLRTAIHGDFIVVGEPLYSGSVTNGGRAHVYYDNGSTYMPIQVLEATTPVAYDYFGRSVAVINDRVIVGGFINTVNTFGGVGRLEMSSVHLPTTSPTNTPSTSPSVTPTNAPTQPTPSPTETPTESPTTGSPTPPTLSPTGSPSVTPTGVPSTSPTTGAPTFFAGDFTNWTPDSSLQVGDGVDVTGGGANMGSTLAGNVNFLAVSSYSFYGAVRFYSKSGTTFDTLVHTKKGAWGFGRSVAMARDVDMIIVGQDNKVVETYYTSTGDWDNILTKSYPSLDTQSCDINFPCDNVAISHDGRFYVVGQSAAYSGTQRGFMRFYRSDTPGHTTIHLLGAAHKGNVITNQPWYAVKGRVSTSLLGQSVHIATSHQDIDWWVVVAGAPGNNVHDDADPPGYKLPDDTEETGLGKYGGYVQIFYTGVVPASGVVIEHIFSPGNDVSATDNKFGSIVRFSDDGTLLFVTAPGAKDGVDTKGAFYVYTNDGTDHFITPRGPYFGPVLGSDFGWSLSLNADGSRVFVGAPSANSNDGALYSYNLDTLTNEYVLQGDFIDSSTGTAGELGRGVYMDRTNQFLYGGVPEDPDDSTDPASYPNVGRMNVYENPGPPTQSPTPSPTPPTQSPTGAPTPVPYTNVGTVKIKMGIKLASKRKAITKETVAAVKAKSSGSNGLVVRVSSVETSVIPSSFFTQVNNVTKLKESFATSRGCLPGQCIVTIDGGNRRLLSRDLQSNFVVSIEFAMSEEEYNSFADLNTTLDDPSFITALAADLGVPEEDIDVVATGGTITVEITLTSDVTGEPSDNDTLDVLANLQSSLDNATSTITEQLGDPDDGVTLIALDLCGGRTCTNRGIAGSGTDAAGCTIETGVCVCELGWWGINCESECECDNGGACVNQYCHCLYPYYGLKCGLNVTCSC